MPASATVSDSKGNVWTLDSYSTQVAASTVQILIASAVIAVGKGGAGHTVTVTNSVGSSAFEGNVSECAGVVATTGCDVNARSVGAASNIGLTSGTPFTTENSEIVFAAIGANSTDTTCNITDPPSGYTSIGVNQDANATIGYEAAYKIVSVKGNQSASWTNDAVTTGSVSCMATYIGAEQSPPTHGGRSGGIDQLLTSDEDEGHFNELDVRNWWKKACSWVRRGGVLVPA